MQDSMYKFMKVGLIHFMAYTQVMKGEGPILETLQKIAEDDFFTTTIKMKKNISLAFYRSILKSYCGRISISLGQVRINLSKRIYYGQ